MRSLRSLLSPLSRHHPAGQLGVSRISTRPPVSRISTRPPGPRRPGAKSLPPRPFEGPRLASTPAESRWFAEDDAEDAKIHARASLATQSALLKGLPPFPTAATRLVQILDDPGYRVRDVVETLEKDPALAAKILRVANSAMLRTAIPCVSLADAVRRMGSRHLRDVAVALAAISVFSDARGAARAVRDHSVGLGAILRTMCESVAPNEASTLFVAGLLHDVGKLLILQTTDIDYRAAELQDVSADAWERAHLGFDHATLGSCVLKLWRIPDPIPDVVAWHHQPSRAIQNGGRLGLLVSLLRVGNVVEKALAQGASIEDGVAAHLFATGDLAYAELNVADLLELAPALEEARLAALDSMTG